MESFGWSYLSQYFYQCMFIQRSVWYCLYCIFVWWELGFCARDQELNSYFEDHILPSAYFFELKIIDITSIRIVCFDQVTTQNGLSLSLKQNELSRWLRKKRRKLMKRLRVLFQNSLTDTWVKLSNQKKSKLKCQSKMSENFNRIKLFLKFK